ncbi:hotdog fold domain-containing protein [Citricoccus nitrophenolicus]|uniref:hotdog fold domain-containing protein n=1 Tax=Citricoccus nitrophenolicus TaxID=863575 RepID=UPI0031E99018
MPSDANPTLTLFRRMARLPGGHRLFTAAFTRRAPYFGSAHLQVRAMEPHYGEVHVPLRRSTRNHIGTLHVMAVCNGLEAAMGLLAEATVPPGMRWLPKGMEVEYLAKAPGDVICVAESTTPDWDGAPDVPVTVTGSTEDGTVCVRGTIRLWVTPVKPR